jgi:predicted RNA-binding Zn ribbon-like protein
VRAEAALGMAVTQDDIARLALAYVLGSPGRDRLGVCSAAGCDRVFIDRSRNGARRFCSAACQSRTKAAAFRARHR